MAFLNLMKNRLKPKEVNDALMAGSGLPEVSSSDAGEVLTVSNEGKWEAATLPEVLPEVSSSDAGEVLMVSDEGEWESSDIVGLLPDVDSTDVGKIATVNSEGEWVAMLPALNGVVFENNTVRDTNITFLGKTVKTFYTTSTWDLNVNRLTRQSTGMAIIYAAVLNGTNYVKSDDFIAQNNLDGTWRIIPNTTNPSNVFILFTE